MNKRADDEIEPTSAAGAGSLLSINLRRRPSSSHRNTRNQIQAFLDVWSEIYRSKGYVTAEDFGPESLGDTWSNCFVLRPAHGNRMDVVRIGRVPSNDDEDHIYTTPPHIAQNGTMLLEWVKDLARESFERSEATYETDQSACGTVDYACAVVPLFDRFARIVELVGLIDCKMTARANQFL